MVDEILVADGEGGAEGFAGAGNRDAGGLRQRNDMIVLGVEGENALAVVEGERVVDILEYCGNYAAVEFLIDFLL